MTTTAAPDRFTVLPDEQSPIRQPVGF